MEDLPIKQFFPQWDLETLFYKDDIAGPMVDDASKYTHPIYTNEKDPEKLTLNYDSITYEKVIHFFWYSIFNWQDIYLMFWETGTLLL